MYLRGFLPLVYALALIAIILTAVSVSGQESRTEVFSDFTGGIVAGMTEALDSPKHGFVFTNVDPSRIKKSMMRREGFIRADSADSQPSTNRVGVYGYTNISYDRILFQTVLNDSNWQDLYTSDMENDSGYWLSPDKDAFKRRWVYESTLPDWSSHNNSVFLSDQVNYPVAIDARGTGDSAARPAVSLYLPPPGAPLLEIIDSSGLTGQFRYAVATWPNWDSTITTKMDWTYTSSSESGIGWRIGYISPVLTLNDQSVVIHVFPAIVEDSSGGGWLSTWTKFRILRTKADLVDLSEDSLYFLGDTITFGAVGGGALDATYFIDDGITPTFVGDSGVAMSNEAYVYVSSADPRPTDTIRKYTIAAGSPSYDVTGTNLTGLIGWSITSPEYVGEYFPTRYLGHVSDSIEPFYVHYFCTYYDTLLGIESDSSKNLVFGVDTSETNDQGIFGINFPRIPLHPQYANCVFRVYRATRMFSAGSDSIYTFAKDFQLVGQHEGANARYGDHAKVEDMEEDLENHPYWAGSPAPPERFKGITFYDDRGYAWYDNRVWVTDPDSLRFSQLGFVAVNPELGDEITTIVPAEDRIIIYTTRERHEIYEDDWGNLTLVSPAEISRGIGCINPHVMESWRGSRIYMSADGRVYIEGHVPGRPKGSQTKPISYFIDDILTKYSYDELRRATAAIVDDNKYFLSFPDKDTVFVCFLDIGEFPWFIYEMSFLQGTFYKNHTSLFKGATGELVFTSGQDQKLYRWGGVDDDSIDIPDAKWRSLPFGMEANPYPIDGYVIFTAGMATDSTDTMVFSLINDQKATVYTDTVVTSRVYHTKYYPLGDLTYSNWWQVEVDFLAAGATDSMRLIRIDIYKGYPESIEGGE